MISSAQRTDNLGSIGR